MQNLKKLFLKNITKQFLVYGGHGLVIWITHLLILSVIAFFHFVLNHRLGTIEKWVFNHGWEVVTVSKVIATLVTLKLITLRVDLRNPIKTLFKEGFTGPCQELFIIITFMGLITIYLGKPEMTGQSTIEMWKIIQSIICIFIFYMLDVVLIFFLQRLWPVAASQRFIRSLFFPLMFWIISKLTFLYAKNMNLTLYLFLFFSIFLSRGRVPSWGSAAIFIAFFISPISSLFGFDPLWGSSFSLMKMKVEISALQFAILLMISLFYLLIKNIGLSKMMRYASLKYKSLIKIRS